MHKSSYENVSVSINTGNTVGKILGPSLKLVLIPERRLLFRPNLLSALSLAKTGLEVE